MSAAAMSAEPMRAEPAARHAYREWLVATMAADPRTVCLDSDTGLFTGVDFGVASARYLNLGIAEQNLMGVAAGLAADGFIPYVNTMAAFAASRAVEAVKIDIAYNHLPVHIVATHGGLSAGHLGPTHHALEDLAAMRAMPGMTVVVPGDSAGTVELLGQAHARPGPVYLRLGRKATPALPSTPEPPTLDRLQTLLPGTEVLLVACGPLPVLRCLDAARLLAREGVSAGVVQAHTLKPFDAAGLDRAVRPVTAVVTVEDHWRVGGLGSTVVETLADSVHRPVVRLGVPDLFAPFAGSHEELLTAVGVSAPAIARAAHAAVQRV